jgi:nucleoside-diphosphate-sugar epimerase
MRVFVTGASGHIGSAVVPELLSAGHQVVGLARSDASAAALEAAGAEVRRGGLDDLDGLQEGAAAADGVVHLAYNHDWMRTGDLGDLQAAVDGDLRAVRALGAALEGSDKPFVGTGGTAALGLAGISDRPATEGDVLDGGPRIDAENHVIALAQSGVRSSVLRLPPVVHSTLDHHGFGPALIAIAREKGVSGYVGDGANRWPAVHTLDAARLYRLALESAPAGTRLHAVDDDGVPFRDIAEVIGRMLGVPTAGIAPEAAGEHFSLLAPVLSMDNPASADLTRELLGWAPTHAGLIEDLEDGHYFEHAPSGAGVS